MPMGKGTYKSKKGRPSKKRKTYNRAGLAKITKGIRGGFGAVGDVVSGVGDVIGNAPQTTADITKNVVSGGKKVAKAASKSFSSPAASPMSGPMKMGTSKIGQIAPPGTTYGTYGMQKYSDGGMVRAKPN